MPCQDHPTPLDGLYVLVTIKKRDHNGLFVPASSVCLPSWIMVGRWDCWRSSAAIFASRNANGCRNWIYLFREIFCVPYFSLGQRLRIGAQKWIIVERAANPPRSESSTRPHRGGGLRLVWITRRRFLTSLGFIEFCHG